MNIKQQIENAELFLDLYSDDLAYYWDQIIDCDKALLHIEKDLEALKILYLCKAGKLYDES